MLVIGVDLYMQKKVLLLALGLYLVSTALSYGVFSYVGRPGSISLPSDQTGDGAAEEASLVSLLEIDPNEPVDQPCPLDGKYYTQTEKTAWEKRRPLAVMLENTPDARPQSGLITADVVFEAVAEGGVTRFMAMYYCGVQRFDTTVAPVRSARTYFVDWASGFNWPLYAHVGGANIPGRSDALGQLRQYGWVGENDLNQFSIGYPTFVRDYNRIPDKEIATEHTMVTSTEKLWTVAADRDWTNLSPARKIAKSLTPESDWKAGYQGWAFEKEVPAKGAVNKISYEFWTGYDEYALRWEYDPASDSYQRFLAGQPHQDLETDKQITASNVVVLLTKEEGPINEKLHMMYKTTGTGDALIFLHGEAIEGTWTKKTRESELEFKTDKGKEVEFARGPIWISVISLTNKVEY